MMLMECPGSGIGETNHSAAQTSYRWVLFQQAHFSTPKNSVYNEVLTAR